MMRGALAAPPHRVVDPVTASDRFRGDQRSERRPARAGDDRRAPYRDRDGSARSEVRGAAERRPGYKAEGRDRRDADEVRVAAPPLPDDVTAAELDAEVRRDLRGLQKDTAETVARHLVAAGSLVDDDPDQALAHARYARYRASRIALVREAAGIAAYHAGEWAEALGELRAARRMGGGPGHLAVMADIERALGRPERALDLARGPEARELDRSEAIELSIVAAGARRDLGELDAAVVGLQLPELDPARRDPWSARLFYAYADNLAAAGRESDAVQWFMHAADADEVAETDAAARLAELTGEPSPDDDVTFARTRSRPTPRMPPPRRRATSTPRGTRSRRCGRGSRGRCRPGQTTAERSPVTRARWTRLDRVLHLRRGIGHGRPRRGGLGGGRSGRRCRRRTEQCG